MNANKILKKQTENLTKQVEERSLPLSLEIIKMVGEHGISIDPAADKREKFYRPLIEKVLQLYLDKGTKMSEIETIQALIGEPFLHIKEWTNATLRKHSEEIERKTFGKELSEITVSDLDKKLRELEEV